MQPLTTLLNEDLPNGQVSLMKTANEIEQASLYFSREYSKAPQKSVVLRASFDAAVQSLDNLTCKLNFLANKFLLALDQQADMCNELSDSTGKIKATMKCYREKVARKAIGSCTVSKSQISYNHESRQEMPIKYTRRPIDYNIFQNIGHCLQGPRPSQGNGTMSRRSSASSQQPIYLDRQQSRTIGPKAGAEYAASPICAGMRFQSGTLGRSSNVYRSAMMPHGNQPENQQVYQLNAGMESQIAQSRKSSGSSNDLQNQNGYSMRVTANQQQVYNYSTMGQSSALAKSPVHQPQQKFIQKHIPPPNNPMVTQMSNPAPVATLPNLPDPAQMQYNKSMSVQNNIHRQMSLNHAPLVQEQSPTKLHTQHSLNLGMTGGGEQPSVQPQMESGTAFEFPLPPVTGAFGPGGGGGNVNMSSPTHAPGVAVLSQQQSANMQPQPPRTPTSPAGGNGKSCPPGMVTKKTNDVHWAPDFYLQKVITVYEYSQDKDDELTFGENQLIYVIKKNDDGWWEGIMDGLTGLFPGNYVEPID